MIFILLKMSVEKAKKYSDTCCCCWYLPQLVKDNFDCFTIVVGVCCKCVRLTVRNTVVLARSDRSRCKMKANMAAVIWYLLLKHKNMWNSCSGIWDSHYRNKSAHNPIKACLTRQTNSSVRSFKFLSIPLSVTEWPWILKTRCKWKKQKNMMGRGK